jgi:hypothetical protein
LPNPIDLDNFKAEILREMRAELAKTKQEIIEGNDFLLLYVISV